MPFTFGDEVHIVRAVLLKIEDQAERRLQRAGCTQGGGALLLEDYDGGGSHEQEETAQLGQDQERLGVDGRREPGLRRWSIWPAVFPPAVFDLPGVQVRIVQRCLISSQGIEPRC